MCSCEITVQSSFGTEKNMAYLKLLALPKENCPAIHSCSYHIYICYTSPLLLAPFLEMQLLSV
ncbi:hypothetical protein ES319_A05G160300v1 [Gossypium barbadense]|uniref:Uncharacterized protein n=2 Tax=Gossypium TaxID=3633 RepID=A0A5J5VP77_GOSBA|nr:hypothetical protein ES319_A05G160300v1 [Gossypium barbadense]TYH17067.1 hypothetical protein ES288_A05G164100v1 [Gossypium darwinii]